MGKDEFTFWVELPAGTKHVVFEDLPHLIALALWPDEEPNSERRDFSYGGARINLEEELAKAVDAGLLQVSDPLTLGPHTFPIGKALRRSVVLLHDLRDFLAQRGGDIGVRLLPSSPGSSSSVQHEEDDFQTIGLIAKDAAMRQHAPHPGETDMREDIRNSMREITEADFLGRLIAYVKQGKLKAVNPINGAPYDPGLPGLDERDPRWSLSNTERHKALEFLGQLKYTDEAGHTGWSLQSTRAHAAEAADRDCRQARGFYTLREAAQRLADAHKLNSRKLLQQLIDSFHKGHLTVRDPETQAPLHNGNLSDFHHWVTADDIDELLSRIWRVTYRFPRGDSQSTSSSALPKMILLAEVTEGSNLELKRLLKLGLGKAITLLVEVPHLGACVVPHQALSAFLADEFEFEADGMVEHYSGATCPRTLIRLNRVSVLADDIEALAGLDMKVDRHRANQPSAANAANLLIGPTPLSTGDIAFCFDGLKWTEDGWKKPLGDKPQWLKSCVAIAGKQGKEATHWNPVLIGAALVHRSGISAKSVRSRFQTKPLLKPWLVEWQTYEEENLESD